MSLATIGVILYNKVKYDLKVKAEMFWPKWQNPSKIKIKRMFVQWKENWFKEKAETIWGRSVKSHKGKVTKKAVIEE